jgi:hypothetical protein
VDQLFTKYSLEFEYEPCNEHATKVRVLAKCDICERVLYRSMPKAPRPCPHCGCEYAVKVRKYSLRCTQCNAQYPIKPVEACPFCGSDATYRTKNNRKYCGTCKRRWGVSVVVQHHCPFCQTLMVPQGDSLLCKSCGGTFTQKGKGENNEPA